VKFSAMIRKKIQSMICLLSVLLSRQIIPAEIYLNWEKLSKLLNRQKVFRFWGISHLDLVLGIKLIDLAMLNLEYRIFILIFSSLPALRKQQIIKIRHVQIDQLPRTSYLEMKDFCNKQLKISNVFTRSACV
jgi:hypothetical protein